MDSTSVLGGLGGLFGGFQNGLQMLLALQKAEEDRAIRAREATTNEGELSLKRQQYADTEADKPALNIQKEVLGPQNIQATLPDIQREYTPPSVADTFKPKPFAPPAFGSGYNQRPTGPTLAQGSAPGLDLSGSDAQGSHIAQVLERAKRYSNFNANQDILSSTLAAAGRTAQATQAPVAGHFGSGADEGTLPQGFTATADKTFSPWQMRGPPDPDDKIFAPLLNDPLKQVIMQSTQAETWKRFLAWQQRRFGGLGIFDNGAGAAPSDPNTAAPPPVSTHQQRRGFGNPGYKGPGVRGAAAPPSAAPTGGRVAPDSLLLRLDRQFNQDNQKVRDELVRLGYDPDAAATP